MNAFALHLPEGRGLSRWILAGVTILIAHAAIVAAVVWWYARRPVEPNIIPAIAVTLAPVESSSPEIQNQDIAVGPTMQQAEAAPKEPPKVEEKPMDQVVQPPSPPREAEVTLPRVEPEQVEKPKPEERPPAPETRAPQKTEHVGQFSQAGSDAYNALVFGHLQRFKRYPSVGARGTGHGGGEVRLEPRGRGDRERGDEIVRQRRARSRSARNPAPRQSLSAISGCQTGSTG